MTGGAGHPPGPPLPRRMQMLAFRFAPLRFTEACRRRYGDIVMFRRGENRTHVMVFEPELVKQVVRRTQDEVQTGPARTRVMLGARSLVGLEGREHRDRRRLLAPHFHGQRVSAHAGAVRDVTDRVVDSWPTGEEFPLLPSMRLLTSEVIAGVVLGLEEEPRWDELRRRLQAGRRPADEFLRDEIARRRAAPDGREDVLSLLLAPEEDDEPMADQELRDDLFLLLLSGFETTAIGLAWAFELLLRHPATLERLEAELAIGEEEYLKAVVKETLRLRPPVPYVRRVVRGEPYALGEYLILPGTVVTASIVSIHRRTDHYPDPLAFRPERYLASDPPGIWMPFGAGPRHCLGASFATFEMGNVIRRVLERTRLRPAGRRPEKATRGPIASPARGVRVIREPRM